MKQFRVNALYSFKNKTIYLWLCAAVSRALRGGVGDPCSVTLSTSKLFLSGRQRPWRVSMGESTRFRGGSAEKQNCYCITGSKLILNLPDVLWVFIRFALLKD